MMKRLVRYALPVLAAALFLFAVQYVIHTSSEPARPPAGLVGRSLLTTSPYANSVAGAGLVESSSENISLGAFVPGIVTGVFVVVGQQVEAGDRLFGLDDRPLQAQLQVRRAAVAAALAELERLKHLPRPEDVPVSEAQVRQAAADLRDKEQNLARRRKLASANATTAEELDLAEAAAQSARAELDRTQAQLTLLKAGAWEFEIRKAEAAVTEAEADVASTQADLDRLVVKAPIAGEILQVNVRLGEFVGAPPGLPLIILGKVERLHVRVDIDEHDIPRYRPGAPATGYLKGDPLSNFPLDFVRVEPYVIPKKSLTGENTERIDTRVLQVIYRVISNGGPPLYVGQQVDVYFDAATGAG